MHVEISLATAATNAAYLTWGPTPIRVRLLDAPAAPVGSPPNVMVTLRAEREADGGDLRFQADSAGAPAPAASLRLQLPRSGSSITARVYGRFRFASRADGDVRIVAREGTATAGALLGRLPVMVRIRKNANQLSAAERSRFLAALGTLNNHGTGRFIDFRAMHTEIADEEAHGHPGFLPWHRAYLLDLERELQAIDPSVALPYWRFDQAAPNLFTRDFMGETDATGNAEFSPTNPLLLWANEGVPGVFRATKDGFDPLLNPARDVQSESATLTSRGAAYGAFRGMEGDPHGRAHTRSFLGSLNVPGTAPLDPLFFLLHCNVDRLWAKWQQANNRYDPMSLDSYNPAPAPTRVGHNRDDTMWPWNGVVGGDRPPTAPGGSLAPSPVVTAPGARPRVRDMIDFQGRQSPDATLGFAYDDVAYL